MRGAGIWLRRVSDVSPQALAEHLSFIVVPFHSGERGRVNRQREVTDFVKDCQSLGVDVYAMDWLPTPEQGVRHLPELVDYAGGLGCAGLMVDAEPDAGWRYAEAQALTYGKEMASLCKVRGLETSYTDYGRGGNSPAVMDAFLKHVLVGLPQSYDPKGTYATTYHLRSEKHWTDRGAREVVMGVGIWLRGEKRHRDAFELRRHLENVPDTVNGVCGWYAASGPLKKALPVLSAWAREREDTGPMESFRREEVLQMASRAKEVGDSDAASALIAAHSILEKK